MRSQLLNLYLRVRLPPSHSRTGCHDLHPEPSILLMRRNEKESSSLYFSLRRDRVCKEGGLGKCSCLEKGSFCGLGVEWEQIQWQSRSGKQNNSLGENLDKARSRSLLFSHSVVSNSLQPHGLQPARLPFPSLSPRVCSDSCPSTQ